MAALAGLSAAGSAAGIGSFFLDVWGVKSREKKFMELDHLLEETGKNLQQASDTISQNANILEPKVKTSVLKGVKTSSLKHEKNINLQVLAHKGKLSRSERKGYSGSVKENARDANHVYLKAQHSSNVARTTLLLVEAEASEGAHDSEFSSQCAVPQTVNIASSNPVSVRLEPAMDSLSYTLDPSTETHEPFPLNEDPFIDPTLHDQRTAVVSLELRSMTI